MASTTTATGAANAKVIYSAMVFKGGHNSTPLSGLFGSTEDSAFQERTENKKGNGESVKFDYIPLLDPTTGIRSEKQSIEGHEKDLTTYTDTLTLKEEAFAVKTDEDLSRLRRAYDYQPIAVRRLTQMFADFKDVQAINALTEDNAPTTILYKASGTLSSTGTEATATAAIEAADKLDIELIRAIKVKIAKRTDIAGNEPAIRPINIKGMSEGVYCLLVSPDAFHDLRESARYDQLLADTIKAANATDHPIFKGQNTLLIDGIVVKQHNRVKITTDWGSGGAVTGSKNILVGAQALLWAWGKNPEIVEHVYPYKQYKGWAYKLIYKVKKPIFNSNDYGSMAVYTSRSSI